MGNTVRPFDPELPIVTVGRIGQHLGILIRAIELAGEKLPLQDHSQRLLLEHRVAKTPLRFVQVADRLVPQSVLPQPASEQVVRDRMLRVAPDPLRRVVRGERRFGTFDEIIEREPTLLFARFERRRA